MTKTIKFNLKCNNQQIRTIENLQHNFVIEDILTYYEKGILDRWLTVHGYEDELKLLRNIKSEDSVEIIRELLKIFNIETNDEEFEKSVYLLGFQADKKKQLLETEKRNYNVKQIIEDYKINYEKIIKAIVDHPTDMPLIKTCINQLMNDYKWIFELNYKELFWLFTKKSQHAIMALLMNSDSRDYFLPIKVGEKPNTKLGALLNEKKEKARELGRGISDDEAFIICQRLKRINAELDRGDEFEPLLDIENNRDKAEMFYEIENIIKSEDFITRLGNDIKRHVGTTKGRWNNIEPRSSKCMIIKLEGAADIRPKDKEDVILSNEDVKNKFLIIDGIDYKSKLDIGSLLYMEI
ncbi:MAG: hypothetical protein KHZ77_02315 [Veillonella sp.]|uniref:hypothetical protein n=1 Tax=Veillonella sp. TaxID=1926307 RepID=UPI0025EFFF91|nr:hypothetical protein [Veillonella sp.]MBS4912981.1 hypothetical protein [Veillonella sp.]